MKPDHINSLWNSDAIWRHRSRWIVAQVKPILTYNRWGCLRAVLRKIIKISILDSSQRCFRFSNWLFGSCLMCGLTTCLGHVGLQSPCRHQQPPSWVGCDYMVTWIISRDLHRPMPLPGYKVCSTDERQGCRQPVGSLFSTGPGSASHGDNAYDIIMK